jgi:hypothetical protein
VGILDTCACRGNPYSLNASLYNTRTVCTGSDIAWISPALFSFPMEPVLLEDAAQVLVGSSINIVSAAHIQESYAFDIR